MILGINYRKTFLVLGALFALIVIYWSSFYNYLLVHGIIELINVVLGFSVFIIAWNSEKYMKSTFFSIIGVAYLFVSGFDLLHILSTKGMLIFRDYDYYATQVWIAGRYLESLSLLLAFSLFYTTKKLRMPPLFGAYLILSFIILLSIYFWKLFPECYIEGVGLTPFKIYSEYFSGLISFFAVFLLVKNKDQFGINVYFYLFWSIILSAVSELFFSINFDYWGIFNLIGHYFKVISFYLIYKAIVETGIRQPYELIFREIKLHEQKLERMAIYDELTGLYNRRAGLAFLENQIIKSEHGEEPLTVCFIDIDQLKAVNDRYGHHEGDFLIKKIPEVLQGNIRESDRVCRIGGDEFLVVLTCNLENARNIIQRAKNTLTAFNSEHIKSFNCDFSYGFSEYRKNEGLCADQLIEEADNNMYQYKQNKRSNVRRMKTNHQLL
ncbi:MASE3 domain-containing protein [Desulfitobacterium sp. Sab5]|uniref:sensor domain-containing diguanylate cyclase n=1 Tax=Desulfitobacterium nosdiversum TaxID=3375356 RepID=UPI003CEC0A55